MTTPTPAAAGTPGSAASANPLAAEKVTTKSFIIAIVVGFVGSSIAQFFLDGIDQLQHLYFFSLPQAMGLDALPWWILIIGLLVAAAIILAARRLPGATGRGPLTGFHFDDPVRTVPGVLIAAAATLIFGASLGPEAPLIVVGSTCAALIMRKSPATVASAAMFLGGFAAIGSIFGNPFVAAFMLLEFVAVGAAPRVLMLPGLVALGAGYLTQVGWAHIPGLGLHSLAVDGLPQYPTLKFGDLAASVVVAIVVAIVCAVTRELGERVDAIATKASTITLIVAALGTAIVAIIAVYGFGANYTEILFSGQSGMPAIVAETSIGLVIVIIVGKVLVYALGLGGGFRGGPIFPAAFIGVACGVLAHLVLPDVSVTPLVALGVATASTVMTRLPFTSGLLGLLIIGTAGAGIAPFAIVGAVIGFFVRQGLDRFNARTTAHAAATPA